jgi:cytochrome b6-f complex iron-sulfur subunit
MDRREFLSKLGIGAAATCALCIGGCKPEDSGITAPTNVDFTLDLSAPANSGLLSVGGSLVNDGVIVAHTRSGFVAVSAACTHQGTTVYFDAGANDFVCPSHGSTFTTSGSVINGPASTPLGHYNTKLAGNSLRVYS